MAIQSPPARSRVWSWLNFIAYATIGVVWVVTLGSMFAGTWPTPARWLVLLSATTMVVSSRVRETHPNLSVGLMMVASVGVIAGMMWQSR